MKWFTGIFSLIFLILANTHAQTIKQDYNSFYNLHRASTMMSTKELKNQMQDDINNNLCQADVTEVTNNNEKTINVDKAEKRVLERTYNDFNSPDYENNTNSESDRTCQAARDRICEAKRDGKCQGEVKIYGHAYFNCLTVKEYHKFCKYHYDNATYCPVHPCFNRVL